MRGLKLEAQWKKEHQPVQLLSGLPDKIALLCNQRVLECNREVISVPDNPGGAMREIVFFVRGIPQAQGSTKAFVKNGKPVITSTNKSLKDWRTLVALEAQNHAPDSVFSNAVNIGLTFMLPRPKSLPKKYWRHVKRPDLDKLIRAVCDSLTGIIYRDDSQVFSIVAAKFYEDAGHPVGVKIEVHDVVGV